MSDFLAIFVRPGKVFAHVRQRKKWVAAFIAVMFLATLPTIMVISTAGIELLTLQRYQHSPKLTEAIGGDSAVERAVSSSNDRWTKLLVVGRVVGTAGASLVLLALAFAIAVSFFDKRPNFFLILGTVSYAAFPFVFLGVIISAILLNVSDHTSLDLENMPGLNLGRLLDPATGNPAILAMAAQMDVLLGGEILLMSFGLTKVTALTFIQGIAICGSIWAIVVLWKAALMVYL